MDKRKPVSEPPTLKINFVRKGKAYKNIGNKNDNKNVNSLDDINIVKKNTENKQIKVYPKFEDNDISTRTYIVYTNIYDINLEYLHIIIPTVKYIIKPKKRGRKKKDDENIDYNIHLTDGCVINISNSVGIIAGTDTKSNRKVKKKGFRNAISIVMRISNKNINCKICKNGKLQITGCKTITQVEDVVKYLWEYISPYKFFSISYDSEECEEIKESKGCQSKIDEGNINGRKIYNNLTRENGILYKEKNEVKTSRDIHQKKRNTIQLFNTDSSTFKSYFKSVMCNISFKLDIDIDRKKLDNYICENTEYKSLWGCSFGYTGVNIKFPNDEIITDKIRCIKILRNGILKRSDIPFEDFKKMDIFTDIPKNKRKFITFLVFHSGKVNMSSADYASMKPAYDEFIKLIDKAKDIIKLN